MPSREPARKALLLASCLSFAVASARAALDVDDRGPILDAGAFAMRVTNAGILGNAFFDQGRSFDPSLEFPRGSGHELLNHAELWVGAKRTDGAVRVSGGPMLEWRPTLDPDDRVRGARAGHIGSLWNFDDDGDGKVDEDPLNGRDDDGDGRIDEDFGMVADQQYASDYRDDEPTSVNYAYATGETHVPLHLSVHEESFAWALPGFDHVAAFQFTIMNVGTETLHDLQLGVYADLDSRDRSDTGGHLNDVMKLVPYRLDVPEGTSVIGGATKACFTRIDGVAPVVHDGDPGSRLPAVALVPVSHTTDPLGYLVNYAFPGAREAQASARAPRRDTTFRYSLFGQGLPSGQGGPPILDADRYRALQGDYPQSPPAGVQDWAVLLSCGPFARLEPSQTVQFAVAFVVAPSVDSLGAYLALPGLAWRGTRYNFQPDRQSDSYLVGETGINGHEICYEPPPGVVFNYDPHCPLKFFTDPAYPVHEPGSVASESTYATGHCIWSDFDCDACTGLDGKETQNHWQVGGLLPPKPTLRVVAGDTVASLLWDNLPEIMLRQPGGWNPGYRFGGYRIYRSDDWRRQSLLPPPETWQQIAQFRPGDLAFAGPPLAPIIDSSVQPDTVAYGQPHYPPGRYRFVDHALLDGFDYLYVVTTLFTKLTFQNGAPVLDELESPLTSSFDEHVTPQVAAAVGNARVWVVPNPYRANAAWERSPVPGDPFTRHVDFFGLPRARSRIRIYTLAGDLVQTIDHDGSSGDGQAPWNLISRNGQDIESGIYLFTVDSTAGHQVGKFVVIR
jgi:hypothetical protein